MANKSIKEESYFKRFQQYLNEGPFGIDGPLPLSKADDAVAKAARDAGLADANPGDDVAAKSTPEPTLVDLSPMQKEVIPAKALAFALGYIRDGNPDLKDMQAIVSNDKYIMDGHHRWAAAILLYGAQAKGKVIQVDKSAEELITILNMYTKALGNQGKSGTGDIAKFASSIPQEIEDALAGGTKMWPKLTAEEVKDMIANKVPDANGDLEKGKQILISNATLLPTSIHPNAPTRVEMPYLEPDKKEPEAAAAEIAAGKFDFNEPYSPQLKAAMQAAGMPVESIIMGRKSRTESAITKLKKQMITLKENHKREKAILIGESALKKTQKKK